MPKDTFFNLADDKRQLIINLAIEEFAANNYQQASISRIVREAGIAKGSFYQYFEDKKDLYLYLIELAGQEKMRFFADNPPPDADMGAFDYLKYLAEIGTAFQFQNPKLNELGYRAVFSDAPFPDDLRQRLTAGAKPFYADLLVRGIETGEIDPDIDRELAAFVLNAVINELGNYIMERLSITPEQLFDDGAKAFDTDQSAFRDIYDGVLDLLKRGMGRQDND